MKKALKIILVYFIFLILCLIAGTLIYSLYLNVINFIAGREVDLFNLSIMLKAFFPVAYFLAFIICPIVSYYRIRHPAGIGQTIGYILICVITWGLYLPGLFYLNNYCNQKFQTEVISSSLSEGYFRKVDSKVYYFTDEFKTNDSSFGETTSAIINLSDKGSITFENVKDYPTRDFNRKAVPFKDILIKDTFTTNLVKIPIKTDVLISLVKSCFADGFAWKYIVLLLSIACIICSLYGVTNIFEWRLLNSVLLFFGTSLILIVNSSYFNPVFNNVINKLTDNGFFYTIGTFVEEPLLFVINVLFMLITITVGIVKFAVHKHSLKK